MKALNVGFSTTLLGSFYSRSTSNETSNRFANVDRACVCRHRRCRRGQGRRVFPAASQQAGLLQTRQTRPAMLHLREELEHLPERCARLREDTAVLQLAEMRRRGVVCDIVKLFKSRPFRIDTTRVATTIVRSSRKRLYALLRIIVAATRVFSLGVPALPYAEIVSNPPDF